MTTKIKSTYGRCAALCISLGLAPVAHTHAAAVLTSSAVYDAITSLYTYTYSVENNGLEDIVLVSIPTSTAANVMAITPPIGFSLTYDPSQAVLNLNEDNDILTAQTFAPATTTGPFGFKSPLAPIVVSYTAFDALGNEFTGNVQSPIPEPSAAMLAGIAAAGLCSRRRRII
jgi:hypothetical protein